MQKNETTDSEPANCTDLLPYKLAKFGDFSKIEIRYIQYKPRPWMDFEMTLFKSDCNFYSKKAIKIAVWF